MSAKIKKHSMSRPSAGQWGFMLGFGLPAFVLFFYVCVAPMFSSAYTSFYDYSGYGDMVWVGIDNYTRLLTDDVFLNAIVNDVLILFGKEIIIIVLTVTFAVSITRLKFAKWESGFFRFWFYLPGILSSVVISKVWKYFFDLELFSMLTGLTTPDNGWIATYPIQIITFVASWCGIGGFMIVLIAAINNIPKELYEAAEVDGAGQFRQLFSITLPSCVPQVKYMATTIIIGIVGSNMNLVKLFLGDSMGGSGFTVMGVYEYDYAFTHYQLGYANACAVVLMFVVITLSYILNYGIAGGKERKK